MQYDYDALIIGSGFGGSVAALRLSQKGYRVAVLEQGRRISKEDMQATSTNPLRLFWMPGLGLKGFFTQTFFRNFNIVGGVGVGGGSLVYAAVLIQPEDQHFELENWKKLGIDWAGELKPCYAEAARMLGRTQNPYLGKMDEYLKQTAVSMGAGDTFGSVPLGIYFGVPGVKAADPFFNGQGPERVGCDKSGMCLTGCPSGSKNSLDLNYLYLAEKLGAKILPEHKATLIRPLPEGGYEVEMIHPLGKTTYPNLRARKVFLAAGVLGTLTLLFRSRDEGKTLPSISPNLGRIVRTNSEAVVGILSRDSQLDLSCGTTISSDFYPNPHTHITQNRFPQGYTFMKLYSGPLVDDVNPTRRALKTIWQFLRHPLRSTASLRAKNWYKRTSILTVMQHLDNQITMTFGRSLLSPFSKALQSKPVPGKSAPSYIPEANEAARVFAEHADGIPINVILESLLNISTTAHILSGAQMGISPEEGVIDTNHAVFGYPGIYVIDASVMPANLGVNPALTITALAERCMSKIPDRASQSW